MQRGLHVDLASGVRRPVVETDDLALRAERRAAQRVVSDLHENLGAKDGTLAVRRYRNPVEIHGIAAITISARNSAPRCGQTRPMA